MVQSTRVVINDGVVIEPIGDDFMALVPGAKEYITLTGDSAALVRIVQEGKHIDTPHRHVTELVDYGILSVTPGLSRRGLIKAGTIGVGAGIAVMSMPSVASASSTGREPLNGYFFLKVQNIPNNIWTFEINRSYSLANNFPSPVPSSNGDDISELRLLTGVTVPLDDVALPDGTSYYVFWTPTSGFTPSDGIQGDFDWVGDDQVTRYFRVTFTQRPDE